MSEMTHKPFDAEWLEQILASQLFLRCDRYGPTAITIIILAARAVEIPVPGFELLEYAQDPLVGGPHHPLTVRRLSAQEYRGALGEIVYRWSMTTQYMGWMDRQATRFSDNGDPRFVHPNMLVALGRAESNLATAIGADPTMQGDSVLRRAHRRLWRIADGCVRQLEERLESIPVADDES